MVTNSKGAAMKARLIHNRLRRAAAVAISAGVVLTTTILTAPTASASTYVTSGSPGTSYFQKTVGSYDMGEVILDSGRVTAYRSPASTGTQTVTIRWRVWRMLAGLWSLDGNFSTTYTVYPGQYVAFPGYTGRELSNYYSTDLTITWRTSNGTFLGQSYRDLIHSSDYQCGVSMGCGVVWAGGQYSLLMY
jgi:hypothetical protein